MLELMFPKFLWLLLIIPVIILYEIFVKSKRTPRIVFSRVDILREAAGHHSIIQYLSLVFRMLIITLLVFALARPRYANKEEKVTGEGVDIFLVMDVSPSMRAVDFRPTNRLEASKKVAVDFINKRHNDKIGIVTFADAPFTQAPLTIDYNILMSIMENIQIDEKSQSTAIGMGLAMGVARLKDSEAESKIIILLTDGANNAGEINPLMATDLAKSYDIKVYTIGVGKNGLVDFPVQDRYGNTRYRKVQMELDMDLLNQIAEKTGTKKAYRAQNTEQLEKIFTEIDKMEKYEYKIENYYSYDELFPNILIAAMIMLLLELLVRIFYRKVLP